MSESTLTSDKIMQNDSTEQQERSGSGIIRFILIGVLVAALAAALVFLPVKDYLISALEWTKGLGSWGPVFVVFFYIVAAVFFMPGSILTLGSGFIFGVLKGFITVSIAATLGGGSAFLVGRTLLRGWVEKKVGANPKFAAIDEAVGKQGFKIVFLTRLSPVLPFNLLNYAFGLTRVPFWKYMLATWIGMMPATFMYVYFGSALRSLTEVASGSVQGGTAQTAFFWAGLAVTIIVVVIITRIAKKAFQQAIATKEAEAGS
ncbi:TVP38/TMEM64 family protein [Acidobacteriota bacterium]